KSYVYPVAYSPDGQWIASGSWDHTARLWDAVTGELCATFPHEGNVRGLAFTADSSYLITANDRGNRVQTWDVATGRRRKDLLGQGPAALAVALSPDGRHLASVDAGGNVCKLRITETAAEREIASWSVDATWEEEKPLAYSPDGARLAAMGKDLDIVEIR